MRLPDHIGLHRLVYVPERCAEWLRVLSEEERARWKAFGSEKRQREFLAGRVAARELLAAPTGMAPENVRLVIAEDGAVEVPEVGLHLSIAHGDGQAVAAVSPQPVGVDLEKIRPTRPDLYRFLLGEEEQGLLGHFSLDHDHTQVLLWTLKEAVLKAHRTGFRLSPKKIRLTPTGPDSAVAMVEGEARWEIRYEECDGCYLAVAFR